MASSPPDGAALAAFLDAMPDAVKLTIVGLAMEPLTLADRTATRLFLMTLDHFVARGIALVSIDGPLRSYRLTVLGMEIYERVRHEAPSDDGTNPANDMFEADGDAPPGAA